MAPAAATTTAQGARRAAVSEEERRRNRKTSNRLSARKSRMKRQQHVDELTATAERLGRENEAMRGSIDGALGRCRLREQENRVLAAHARELCATLVLRNSQLRAALGNVADVPGIPDHLLQLYGGEVQMMPVHLPSAPPPPAMPLENQMLFCSDAVFPPSAPPPPPPPPVPLKNQMPFWPDAMFDAELGAMLGF